jgi:hypothetical protein
MSSFGIVNVYFDIYTTPSPSSVISSPIKYHYHYCLTPLPPNSHVFCRGTYFQMLNEIVALSFCVEILFQN